MKEYPETHQQGILFIEQVIKQEYKQCDFGIQIAKDGRVWICVNGVALLRFKSNNIKQEGGR